TTGQAYKQAGLACRLLLGVLPRPITDKGPPKRLSPSLHQHHPPNKQRTGTSSLPCFVSLSSRRTARSNRPFSIPHFCSLHHYIQSTIGNFISSLFRCTIVS